ncbi:nuclease SbcCD subunit D [Tetragenococcus halophilus subsp. halophilus]|nr:nuclease SbcCD subunit D [Tetragenococcus halophilus subsp. halophilus]GFK22675.1 exonuclease SbcD [Tetragenococcus halophilus]GBD81640.1 nuclease SbcCD subunit D [Tetragenococcus halophilus subsp. halophilus]GFK25061.1 exonuclease SbcD [Tetragenococcus halophilus]GFK29612.1 exonuclease SbcD [Tetragenococcus halophilus]
MGKTFLEVKTLRFLHTADWHIGKKLHGYDLLVDQKEIIHQILDIALTQQVDAIVIAGDLYDRSVPSVEACELLNQTFIEMNLEKKLPILAISGNHDSAVRLSTGMPWYEQTDFHLYTDLKQSFEPVDIGDVQFFLLPYFEPIAARLYFEEESLSLQAAIQKIIEKMRTAFDKNKKQVLVTHFFIAGSRRSDSETAVEVGGLNSISYELVQDFDYVALGHLHSKNALKTQNALYSGSPLKFSLSEKDDSKGVWIVDSRSVAPEFHELVAKRDVCSLQASFEELTDPSFYQRMDRNCFWYFQLTDRSVITNMMNQLRAIYPNILGVERVNGRRETKQLEKVQHRKNTPYSMLTSFFEDITGDRLTKKQRDWLDEGLQQSLDTEKRNDDAT